MNERKKEKDNRVITTSVKVAEYFGKRHKDVLRAIRNLQCSDDFARRNFAPSDFIDKNGDVQPMYSITRDGCMMHAVIPAPCPAHYTQSLSGISFGDNRYKRRLLCGRLSGQRGLFAKR
ncbi:hypothetical protein CRX72_18890 [Pantoea sp. BRM17]|nr:hypothetical protein CRX72_18890 [Pantoea sp. BRM17]